MLLSPLPDVSYPGLLHIDPPAVRLMERAIARGETLLAVNGALVANTVPHTGRSPKDKYVVRHAESQDHIWWGEVNRPLDQATYAALKAKVIEHLSKQPELFVVEAQAGADPQNHLGVKLVSDHAWYAIFFQCLMRRRDGGAPAQNVTIYHAPTLKLDPAKDGTRSDVAVVLNFEAGEIVIVGTKYAGEVKKAVFSYLNAWLPRRGVLPMHCSANIGPAGDTAILFGLSGTGKTTLSADPERTLIGDDEHGWSEAGIFNFEGGCYAKCIKLSQKGEPLIWDAVRFGSILENVALDPITRELDYNSDAITENTRAAYPLDFIPGAEPSGRGGVPKTILFLTCDAYGVLPPLAKLTPAQALYHFLSGYTAKLAGTEQGVQSPSATFSSCFGAPFLTLPPSHYAQMLRERLERFKTPVWLVNTGWSGGPYGVGRRMPLEWTRTLVRAALAGTLDHVATAPDPVFGVHVPISCPGLPASAMQQRSSWSDAAAYDRQAAMLAELFKANFTKFAGVSADVAAAGPK
ncbi:MAG: phosphoenolpyruvate carboxykinase (ATP) [Planctomycetota bacterium]